MDSGYGYGYGSVGMNLRGLRGNRPRLERKVVACTAGTDTGCAVHQANALTMQLGRWLWGIGIEIATGHTQYIAEEPLQLLPHY